METQSVSADSKPSRRLCAYHEAGHAVAAHVLGLTIEQVDILADNNYGGKFSVVMPLGIDSPNVWRYHPLREFVEKYDVMIMAGYSASLIAEEEDPDKLRNTAQSDVAILEQDAEDAFPDIFCDPWVKEMYENFPEEKLGVELVETIDQLDKRKIDLSKAYYAWIRLRAEVLVLYPPHREAIKILAEVLLTKETLSGAQTHEIILQALKTV